MKKSKKSFNLNIRVADEDWCEFKNACDQTGVSASTVIRDLCKGAIPYMVSQCPDGRWRPPALVDQEEQTWGLPEIQIVLDLAKTVDEVKDLIYTVLEKNLISWDTSIPVDRDGYRKMIKDAVKTRLKDIRDSKK